MSAARRRILIFGNSGAGKSTLAGDICRRHGFAHLDLDTLAWLPTDPPQRRPIDASHREITDFANSHTSWVIEGCYSDLLRLATPLATEAIWLNLSVEDCIANARARPWEPHKYESKKEQDANLPMLIDWIEAYETREDTFSYAAHQALFRDFAGIKLELNVRPGEYDML